jgi:hypothetical protein
VTYKIGNKHSDADKVIKSFEENLAEKRQLGDRGVSGRYY